MSELPTTRRPAPTPPNKLRLVRPRVGAVSRDVAEVALQSLINDAWIGEGAFAKVEEDNFILLGQLRIDDEVCNVALKQIVARPGLMGELRSRSPRRRARRQYRGAEQVLALGIPTGAPILLATGRLKGRRCDWLLLRRVPGKDVLRHLADNDLTTKEQHETARRVGEFVSIIDSYGWFDRDSKLSNLIRLPTGEIAPVDTVDIQRRPGRRTRMLSAMLAEAMGSDLLPRRTLIMRCLLAAVEEPKDTWRALERFARKQVGKRPKVNVLEFD